MIGLLQRVRRAHVEVAGASVAAIGHGLLVLIGIEPSDAEPQARRLLHKLLNYRVFADAQGKMNLSLSDVDAGLLLVPQFTLAAATDKGLRPSFATAAEPAQAAALFENFVSLARAQRPHVQTGIFGAAMQVHSINDGPVTFWLQTH